MNALGAQAHRMTKPTQIEDAAHLIMLLRNARAWHVERAAELLADEPMRAERHQKIAHDLDQQIEQIDAIETDDDDDDDRQSVS
jgi:hypothetical protein